jgi:DNA-binding NarL/FixJ family response regulator
MEVVGEAATASELLDQVKITQPDLVLFHWRLEETAPGLLRTLQSLCPGLCVIALSARCETRHAALKAGVEAFVWKTEQPEKLLAAITACGAAANQDRVASLDAGTPRDGRRHREWPGLPAEKSSPHEGVQEEMKR